MPSELGMPSLTIPFQVKATLLMVSDGCHNHMISKMATPQSSSTMRQSNESEFFHRPMTTIPSNFGSHQLALGGSQVSETMPQHSISTSLGPHPLSLPNKQSMEVLLPSKEDAIPVSVHLGLQQSECTSKFQSGMELLPRIQNQAYANVGRPFPLTSIKQQARKEYSQKFQATLPMVVGSYHLSSTNKRPPQASLSVKVKEEYELVRSKLRDSLASALTTCSSEQNKQNLIEKGCLNEEKTLSRQVEVSSLQNDTKASAAHGSVCESLSSFSTSNKEVKNFDGNQGLLDEVGSSGNIDDKKEENITCNVHEVQKDHNIVLDDVSFSHSIMEDELLKGHGLCWASDFTDPVPHSLLKRPKLINVEENRDKNTILQTAENLASQIESELFKLFGGVNKKYKEKGRSLLFNLKDPSNPELRERVLSGDVPPERLCSMSAEELASKELSQWRQAKAEEFAQMVMLPDMNIDIRRLVRKTHKGEFQVEVEQDDGAHPEVGLVSDFLSKTLAKVSEVNQGRSGDTAKSSSKTHGISDEFVQGENSDSDERNVSSNLDTRLPERTDYIQDFMEEEMKDTELLPPVVSLDEFMQALDSEPPFENLEVTNLQENTNSDGLVRMGSESIDASNCRGNKVDSSPDISVSKLASVSILDSQSQSVYFHTKHIKEISSPNPGQVAYNCHNSDDKLKSETEHEKQVIGYAPNYSNIWEGFLQLNVSALSNVVSFFLSGEKTSMQGWPNLLEVKGRVRLDAFEKFLQELPLSRSRAIMIVEFSWKEDSMESGQLHLSEAIHSYVTDERVGFSEPAPGVELYLCPPNSKVTGMLAKHLSKEILENVSSVVNGLIGVVVWRRPHVIVSPRVVSSNHKHGSAKRHPSSKKHHERTNHSNSNHVRSMPHANPAPLHDDIDDVPPGFGPPIAREIDDLPEFDFSRGNTLRASSTVPQHSAVANDHSLPPPPPPPNPPPSPPPPPPALAPAFPTSHMRELIQKYGQGESNVTDLGIPVQPWNDEDDIPEWNPSHNMKQMPHTQSLPMPSLQMLQGFQQQQRSTEPIMMNQHHLIPSQQPMLQPNGQFIGMPLHTPIQPQTGGMQGWQPQNVLQQPNGPWWPMAHGMPDGGVPFGGSIRPCHFGGQPSGGRPLAVGPRMFLGFGRANNGSTSWRADNSGGRSF